jgi:hypothetical protein
MKPLSSLTFIVPVSNVDDLISKQTLCLDSQYKIWNKGILTHDQIKQFPQLNLRLTHLSSPLNCT